MLVGGQGAEALSPPAQQQPRHIAEVVQGIADQGQRAKADANGQLQSGEAAVEQHTPAKGRRIAISVFVLDVAWQPLAAHRWMAHKPFVDRVGGAVCRSQLTKSIPTECMRTWSAAARSPVRAATSAAASSCSRSTVAPRPKRSSQSSQ